jgi:hypothetical protein
MRRLLLVLTVVFMWALTAAAQDMAQELSKKWGLSPTPNARLELQETERKKDRGSTEITYRLETSGFPVGMNYSIWMRQSGNQKTFPMFTGYSADSTGKLVCPEESSQPQAVPPGQTPAQQKANCEPLTQFRLTIGHYHKGEPLDIGAVSADGTVRAFAHTFPFPILSRDGRCSLTAELETPTGTFFVIYGEGFDPEETIKDSTTSGKEAIQGTLQASQQGNFHAGLLPAVIGKDSGEVTYTAAGASCHPSITFQWGKAAMKVQ